MAGEPSPWRLAAFDFDRTVAMPGAAPSAEVSAALRRLREAGVVVAVVSGQPLERLRLAVPDADAWAAEGGAVVLKAGDEAPVVAPWPERGRVMDALRGARVPFRSFEVILDVPRTHELALRNVLAPLRDTVLVPNQDAVNVLPAGVDKGTALAALQEAFHIPRERTLAVGDGENDVAMLRQAGLGVAVANATPPVREVAQLRLTEPDGEGVCGLVDMLLGGKLRPPRTA